MKISCVVHRNPREIEFFEFFIDGDSLTGTSHPPSFNFHALEKLSPVLIDFLVRGTLPNVTTKLWFSLVQTIEHSLWPFMPKGHNYMRDWEVEVDERDVRLAFAERIAKYSILEVISDGMTMTLLIEQIASKRGVDASKVREDILSLNGEWHDKKYNFVWEGVLPKGL